MTASTTAVERVRAAYRDFAGNGAGGAPDWLKGLREAGIAALGSLGFPSSSDEAWRLTSVAPLLESEFGLPAAGTAVTVGAPPATGRVRLVFVNGRFDVGSSSLRELPDGVTVTDLATALGRHPDLVRASLGASGAHRGNAFAALNTAFVSDGLLVHVADGVELAEPVEALFLSDPAGALSVSHPRTLLVVGRMGRATVVETYSGTGAYWANAVTEVVVGEGARADVYRVQSDSRSAYHVASTHTRQDRDSVVNLHAVAFGAALARHDITAVLDGEGARCLLNGLYLGAGDQHLDHHTTIDHAKPHCESHEFFNGVLDDRSHGVFAGRIVVREGAQRTDSKQTNNNLLLSEEARADSQPQLEIYADDVRCTHGATLGPIDPKALFYLESRGLGRDQARAMLTYGFGAEVIGRMDVVPLRRQLDEVVRRRLLEPAAAGRMT